MCSLECVVGGKILTDVADLLVGGGKDMGGVNSRIVGRVVVRKW